LKKDVLVALNIDTLKSDGYSFQIELKFRSFVKVSASSKSRSSSRIARWVRAR